MDPKTAERLEVLIKEMNEYLSSHGLTKTAYNAIVDKYLGLLPDQLNKLTADECGEASYLLSQYALYLQRESNQKRAIVEWCERCIDRLVLPVISNYGDNYVKFEQKRECAIKENPLATDISNIRSDALVQLTNMADMPYRVEKMSDRLSALQATRRRKYE